MTSQFFGLNIAASGLRASNASLNTTANNIANANTDGYSRQKVTQAASNALRVFATYGCAGAGVDTLAIDRVRDSFYDVKFRNNEQLLGNASQKNYYNQLVEKYLDDDGNSGFSTLFNKMEASLESVMTAAGTTETKSTYISQLKSVTEYFNNVYNNLQNEQADINAEIKLCADRISSIAQEIASVNKQINVIEMTGAKANELRDKRDTMVDELSKMVSIETKETPVIDENNPSRVTGATRYQIWIAGSYELVDTYDFRKMICVARDEDGSTDQNDIQGLFDIKWGYGSYKDGDNVNELSDFTLDSQLIGGELQGLLAMRDGNNGQYFHGKSANAEWVGDQMVVTVEVDATYLKDMTKCTIPKEGNIHIGPKDYKYDSWTYNGDSTYTFVIDKETLTSVPDVGRGVQIGYANSYQGIPYYMAQMNEWLRQFSDATNEIMVNGYTSDSLEGINILTGTMDTNSLAQYSYEQLTTLSENKGYYFLTGGNFAVNAVLLDNADRLATKADVTEGESEFMNLKKLKEMFDTKKIFRGATSGEFLTKVLADVALNKSNSNTLEETYKSLENTIDNQRLSDSGVDEDEEASNLVKYQNAYALSSKMIQTLSEIYDRLILQTGV
ncbi:flagellar hook-associated protein FlgK2 [Butyrivibrio proteoclasticus B316]|uniref:Flagellar hook-associated protein 1 n=1 Tax=Butyrivibrio proteoclasticus (strain ATCC 51982 / DSM 14932 / B316) TaxID=515622 RepID=E0S024_BUTPB|nr:flagellar basal body rod C-terminal domain-containing protein [Butyrivibrio proteoclasticus]ADL33225.1 flagellar hook-associated protein FlgK2 [Butyrivibrio proteoclasticus B316]